MKVIYEPKGKAREYAPLACNLYRGCPHGCRYCYGPKVLRMKKADFHSESRMRPGLLGRLSDDCANMQAAGDKRPVLLYFVCDPYPPDEPSLVGTPEDIARPDWPGTVTRAALSYMQTYGVTPIILTKGGTRGCRDFDLLKAAGGWFGQTLAWRWGDEASRVYWEPQAAALNDRAQAIVRAARYGVNCWLSVEPVIGKGGALGCLKGCRTWEVQHIKLGKMNGYDAETRAVERSIDWPAYREEARRILTDAGYLEIHEPGAFEVGTFYVKRELREAGS